MPTESPPLSAWLASSLSRPPLSSTQTVNRLCANALAMAMPAGPAPITQTWQSKSSGVDGSR